MTYNDEQLRNLHNEIATVYKDFDLKYALDKANCKDRVDPKVLQLVLNK